MAGSPGSQQCPQTPDVQLQVRAARSQRVQAPFCAPGQVAAQVRLDVVAGGAVETGQVSSHRQPQLVSERHHVIGGGQTAGW